MTEAVADSDGFVSPDTPATFVVQASTPGPTGPQGLTGIRAAGSDSTSGSERTARFRRPRGREPDQVNQRLQVGEENHHLKITYTYDTALTASARRVLATIAVGGQRRVVRRGTVEGHRLRLTQTPSPWPVSAHAAGAGTAPQTRRDRAHTTVVR